MIVKKHRLVLLTAGIAALLAAAPAFAATWTWNGSQGNAHWTNTPNWSPASNVANDGTADVVFGTTGATIQFSPDMNANWSIHSVTFNNTAAAFTLVSSTASTLTLDAGGITNNDADIQTINHAITLAAPQTWNAASGNLVINGAVNNGGNLLTMNAATGTVPTFTGVISGAGGLTKTGSGTLRLGGSSTNTFTGPINVNDGTLSFNKAGGSGAAAFSSTILNIGDGIGAAGSAFVTSTGFNFPHGTLAPAAVSIQSDGHFYSSTETIASLTMSGGTVDLGNILGIVNGGVTTLASSSTALITGVRFDFGGTRTFTVAQGTTPTGIDLDVPAPFAAEGGLPVIKAGPGTLRLSGDGGLFNAM